MNWDGSNVREEKPFCCKGYKQICSWCGMSVEEREIHDETTRKPTRPGTSQMEEK